VSERGFLAFLVVDGALAGCVYALVALVFVVVYKASRMMNFAVGEWVTFAARLVAYGTHGLGLGLAGGLGVGCAGMAALAVAFNATVVRRLIGRPLISLIMVTIGLGTLMRGAAALVFAGVPADLPRAVVLDPLVIAGVPLSPNRLVAAVIAVVSIAVLGGFFNGTRTGLALRAVAGDQQVAMAVGIDLRRYFAITWVVAGVLSVLAGTLWTVVSGGGFGLPLLGFKVFPIVIVGGLDSILGTVVGALVVGVVESLAAGYVDPVAGSGFSQVSAYLVLVAALLLRPHGLFGHRDIRRL
jgi:branched-chain amino acid transport system permease protein